MVGGPVRIKGISDPCEFLMWTQGIYWKPVDPVTTSVHDTYVAVGNGWNSRGVGALADGQTWE